MINTPNDMPANKQAENYDGWTFKQHKKQRSTSLIVSLGPCVDRYLYYSLTVAINRMFCENLELVLREMSTSSRDRHIGCINLLVNKLVF